MLKYEATGFIVNLSIPYWMVERVIANYPLFCGHIAENIPCFVVVVGKIIPCSVME